jgi:hypothetical protein
VKEAAATYRDAPLVAKVIDFIQTAKRPLTMAVRRADLGEEL